MRWLGLLPVAFFGLHLAENWWRGTAGDSLWMCHLSNLLLGLGLLARRPAWIRVAVLWLLLGTPLWLYDLAVEGGLLVSSYLAHLGGLAIGLWALPQARVDRPLWGQALLFYLAVQQMCRMITAPRLNVNLSQGMFQGAELVFTSYWQYWLFTTGAVAALLWLLDKLLRLRLPS